ncbi:MAG: PDZ domain-containing protein [Gemmatimonadota bacterium]|nr:PDZ domain-containing protein [Gemmatimonadota bacterium]
MRTYYIFRIAVLTALLTLAGRVAPVVAQESSSRANRTDARSVLGMTVSMSGSDRDTIGVLVSAVTPGGPADRAGIDDGNRLAEINGVNLRQFASEAGQAESGDAVLRRFARELRAIQPGDKVTLRIFSAGRYRTVALAVPGASTRAQTNSAGAASATSRTDDDARPASLARALDALSDARTQLHQLAQSDDTGALADTIAQAEQELGDLQRRLRDVQAEQQRPRASQRAATTDASAEKIAGMRVSNVTDDLVSYFGEGSDRGLLVLQADTSWDPIRAGDVILRVNGAPVSLARLRDALDRRQSTVELLRRKRTLKVTVYGRE